MGSRNRTNAGGDDRATAITCQDVTRRYGRRGTGIAKTFSTTDRNSRAVTALADVSLGVHRGELLAIAGSSGSGKSTLVHLLAGIDVPTSGTVSIDGQDTVSLTESERTRLRLDSIGIVFQRFNLLPALSARSNVAVPLVERGVPKRQRRTRASSLLERVGLADRATHRPGQLSGGEQQRVAIARALVTDPATVLADEPTGELDTATGERVLSLFEELARDRAVVVASHDPTVHERADRVVQLRDGRIHRTDE